MLTKHASAQLECDARKDPQTTQKLLISSAVRIVFFFHFESNGIVIVGVKSRKYLLNKFICFF